MAGTPDDLAAVEIAGRWGGLRPLAPGDAGPLYALSHDASAEVTWQQMKLGPFPDMAGFAAHVAEITADPHRAFFAVVDRGGAAIGWLCLMEGFKAHGSVELGYVLYTPPMQRTTLATECLYLVMRHAFETLGYGRLEWTCTAENEKSRRAADRLGFVFEGIMRHKLILKGAVRDIAMYSMLADEWPARRRALEAWLDPANFAEGRQIRRLGEAG
jgi:RimJ/RimL family protein N-acetyltransferase